MINWWQGLNERERRLVAICGPLLLIAILYWGLWTPFANHVAEVKQQLQNQRNTLAMMRLKRMSTIRTVHASCWKKLAGRRMHRSSSIQRLVIASARQRLNTGATSGAVTKSPAAPNLIALSRR